MQRHLNPALVTELLLLLLVLIPALAPKSAVAAHGSFAAPERMDETASDFTPRYSNGLYYTIAGFLNLDEATVKNARNLQLQVKSFKKKVPISAVIQPHAAPLVVVIPGLDGRTDSKLGKLWPAWYADAGCHVLTFDSTFNIAFNAISQHGVTGNIRAESECVRDMIAEFLNLSGVKGKVEKIGLVGMSYGGLQALMLGEMAKQNKLPFEIDAIQVWSPPVNLYRTCEILDTWFAQDRWNYTLPELANKFKGHKPVKSDREIPFSNELMRAGIAAVFRLGLPDVIVRNNEMYRLNLLPGSKDFDDADVKRDHAATWGLQKFVSQLTFPYWHKQQSFRKLEDLTDSFDLRNLLPAQGENVNVFIANDDPFNAPEELASLNNLSLNCELHILRGGGHLGFVSEAWTKNKLLSIFKPMASMASTR